MSLVVERAGFLTSVQDLGRAGLREFGVSAGGALDSFGLRVANLLVGNDEGAAGLEITLGGLKFGRPHSGCRAWLAVSGGIDVPVVLGSRSTDLRAQFGGFEGRKLRDGDVIPLGAGPGSPSRATGVSSWTAPHDWVSPAKPKPILRFIRGVDWSRFNDVTVRRFTEHEFTVSPDSDRMGVRLEGPELKRIDQSDLISEAVAPGTIQVPPNGKPILLLGDCQTIGGYPKMAHVITVDLGVAAQLRAGDHIRFSEVSLTDAHRLLLEREREFERFRIGIRLQTT
jgi:antagonist of KipI